MTVRARSTYTDPTNRAATDLTGGAGLPMLPGAEALVATFAQGQREMLEFVTMRLEKDREVIEEARGCRTLPEAIALQSRWAQELMRDYAAETTKMLALFTVAAQTSAGQNTWQGSAE